MNILFIDDDEALVRLAVKELPRRGMTVAAATSAAEAMARLEAGVFDAVVLDYFMPDSDGLDTLQRILALPNRQPILYVTAADDGRLAVAALKAGAADYVIKSVGEAFFDLLAAAIEQAVTQEKLRRENEAAEAAVREARDRAEWLLREVNHRCANSLQLVGSLVSMQATHVKDPTARQALLETVSRINAVGQVHRRLYSTDDVRTVEMQPYLQNLIDELGQALSAEGRGHAIKLDADPSIRIPTDRAISLGVIVSELITNAMKYAYRDGETGEVRVTLKAAGADDVTLTVADDGVGIGAEKSGAKGLGMRIIAAMSDALKGVVDMGGAEKGARVAVTLPIGGARGGENGR
ncbi:MAG: sensor histidine kinase [Hyphomonadaceae bacterium]